MNKRQKAQMIRMSHTLYALATKKSPSDLTNYIMFDMPTDEARVLIRLMSMLVTRLVEEGARITDFVLSEDKNERV